MDVLDAIRTRRSIGQAKPERPPKDLIETILDAARWAPNHFRVEPWRFLVVTGQAQRELGRVDASITEESLPGHVVGDVRETILEKQREKVLRAPVIIAVVVERPATPQVVYIENIAAVAAAVQNMLLAAHALGLGAKWRTGELAYHPKAKAFFGLDPDADILGFIYVGYPDEEPEPATRQPVAAKTTWLGWET
jgi:nitroreductase